MMRGVMFGPPRAARFTAPLQTKYRLTSRAHGDRQVTCSLGQNPFYSKPEITVLDVHGQPVSVKELTTKQRTVFALLRHLG
ncbi:g164 [Coccomyxa elongata]